MTIERNIASITSIADVSLPSDEEIVAALRSDMPNRHTSLEVICTYALSSSASVNCFRKQPQRVDRPSHRPSQRPSQHPNRFVAYARSGSPIPPSMTRNCRRAASASLSLVASPLIRFARDSMYSVSTTLSTRPIHVPHARSSSIALRCLPSSETSSAFSRGTEISCIASHVLIMMLIDLSCSCAS